MAAGRTGNPLDQIQTLWSSGTLTGLDERQLLEAFVAGRESRAQAAFEAIVRRHGPMVLRVCRQLLVRFSRR